MDESTAAAALLVGWDDFQAMAGWAGLIAIVVVLALIERMRGVFATRDDLAEEVSARETADEHRDREMHRVAEMVQQFVGKVEIMERRTEKADRAREREVSDLREEVRTGFAKLTALLEKRGNGGAP